MEGGTCRGIERREREDLVEQGRKRGWGVRLQCLRLKLWVEGAVGDSAGVLC